MGLFIGASILTVLEIFDYIYEVFKVSKSKFHKGVGKFYKIFEGIASCFVEWTRWFLELIELQTSLAEYRATLFGMLHNCYL